MDTTGTKAAGIKPGGSEHPFYPAENELQNVKNISLYFPNDFQGFSYGDFVKQ